MGLFLLTGAAPAVAQEYIRFPAINDVESEILQKIQAESTRIDVATWLLTDTAIRDAIIAKYKQGVTVRIIGDRGSIFEGDINTRNTFEYLASNGVPIRLRYYPTDVLEIMHWKCGIFVGQHIVEFGSANWTDYELKQINASDFHDETAFFTNDSTLVNAFMTKFDEMWADDGVDDNFLDWPDAYQKETGKAWTTPMNIPRGRLVPPGFPTNIPGMIWSQGTSELIPAMITEINRETQAIDIVEYRLTVPSLTDAVIQRSNNANVPVRVLIEPEQYHNSKYPEYELTQAEIDRLYVAGQSNQRISIKQRAHAGLTHMKTLITSNIALIASANFTRNWERDHNYFIPVSKTVLWKSMKDRFNAMWSDTTNYTNFVPKPPDPPALVSPPSGSFSVPTTTPLTWKRAPWAVAFDVYLSTAASNLGTSSTFIGRVDAILNESPPATYSITPSALQPSTTYYWKVVSRTNASLTNSSEIWSFTTASGGGGGGGPTPFNGTPVALPGRIEAENFDNGGPSVAFSDTTAGNSGGQYRTTDVDIEATTDTDGGFNVGWIAPGEWLKYTVNVTTAGTYDLAFRVASSGAGGTFHVMVGSTNITGSLTIPNTGGWQSWNTVTKTGVTLAAGQQVWTLMFDNLGPGGVIGNINYTNVTTSGGGGGGGGGGSTPYGGTAAALPGTIEAEKFDEGGNTVAYSDTTAGNSGGQFRTGDVDIEATTDTGGGFNVGWIAPGEWLKYTVNVTTAGTYDLAFRVASSGSGGTFHVMVGNTNITGSLTIPNTGGWQSWTTVTKTGVALAAGQQVWTLMFDTLGPGGVVGNINYIRATTSGGGGSSTPYGGTPAALPGTLQAENFDEGGELVAYHDESAGNSGGQYRGTDVDIEATSDTGGGYNVGWISPNEWLKYTVNVTATGTYTIQFRVASSGAGGTFRVEVNGADVTGALTIPNTNGWQTWQTISKMGVKLNAGQQVWRVVMLTNGAAAVGNLNWIRVQ